jgi:copper chaperone
MKTIEVKGMSCGHCVKTITQAITRLDPGANVNVDLARGQVSIAQCNLPEEKIERAIREAGYTTARWVHEA